MQRQHHIPVRERMLKLGEKKEQKRDFFQSKIEQPEPGKGGVHGIWVRDQQEDIELRGAKVSACLCKRQESKYFQLCKLFGPHQNHSAAIKRESRLRCTKAAQVLLCPFAKTGIGPRVMVCP